MKPNIITESSYGLNAVRIEDYMYQNRIIFMTEPVTTQTSAELIKQLMYLEQTEPGKEIKIYISSPGGEVTAGLVICDFINHMKSPVTTICIGMASSMGAIIFMHGKKRLMMPHSEIMIHDPTFGSADMGGQKPKQLMEQVEGLMKIRKILAQIISEKTGMTINEVYDKTKKDTFFDAKEALENGIATGIIEDSNIYDVKNENNNFKKGDF